MTRRLSSSRLYSWASQDFIRQDFNFSISSILQLLLSFPCTPLFLFRLLLNSAAYYIAITEATIVRNNDDIFIKMPKTVEGEKYQCLLNSGLDNNVKVQDCLTLFYRLAQAEKSKWTKTKGFQLYFNVFGFRAKYKLFLTYTHMSRTIFQFQIGAQCWDQ